MSSLEQLPNAPIVEAVLDFDCDLPPEFDLAAQEARSSAALKDRYPKAQKRFSQEHIFEVGATEPKVSARAALEALHFRQQDDKQLIQVRAQGYSFNRLAPYTNLDDYLPEIERTWRIYVEIASPIRIRNARLRYINRIRLPFEEGRVDLEKYFKIAPRFPEEEHFGLTNFLTQQSAIETETKLHAHIVLATEAAPNDGEFLPVILDINAADTVLIDDPRDWANIKTRILALRALKNRMFQHSVTPTCIELFQ